MLITTLEELATIDNNLITFVTITITDGSETYFEKLELKNCLTFTLKGNIRFEELSLPKCPSIELVGASARHLKTHVCKKIILKNIHSKMNIECSNVESFFATNCTLPHFHNNRIMVGLFKCNDVKLGEHLSLGNVAIVMMTNIEAKNFNFVMGTTKSIFFNFSHFRNVHFTACTSLSLVETKIDGLLMFVRAIEQKIDSESKIGKIIGNVESDSDFVKMLNVH